MMMRERSRQPETMGERAARREKEGERTMLSGTVAA